MLVKTINFISDFVFQQADVEIDNGQMLKEYVMMLVHLVVASILQLELVSIVFQTILTIKEFVVNQITTQIQKEYVLLARLQLITSVQYMMYLWDVSNVKPVIMSVTNQAMALEFVYE